MSQALHLQSRQWLLACFGLQKLEQLSTPASVLSPNLPEKHFRGHVVVEEAASTNSYRALSEYPGLHVAGQLSLPAIPSHGLRLSASRSMTGNSGLSRRKTVKSFVTPRAPAGHVPAVVLCEATLLDGAVALSTLAHRYSDRVNRCC